MDVEKTIQGILESRAADEERHRRWQVEFAAEQAAIKARQEQFDVRQDQFARDMETLRQAQLKQLETANRLVDVAHSHEARLAETQGKLDALIAIVDGMIRGKM